MKTESYYWVAAVIAAHPERTLKGRTRLQKTVKLLQHLGLPTDYDFTMHYYGPYSDGIQADLNLLRSFGVIDEKTEKLSSGMERAVFTAQQDLPLPDVSKWSNKIRALVEEQDPTVLEVAATYDAFREMGLSHDEAIAATRKKKKEKCDNGRQEKSLELLRKLELATA